MPLADTCVRTAIVVLLVTAGCRPGETPRAMPAGMAGPAAPGIPAARAPAVRVGLIVDTAAITLGSTRAFHLSSGAASPGQPAAAGTTWTVRRADDGSLHATTTTGRVLNGRTLTARSTDGAPIVVAGRPYRGDVMVRPGSSGITVVNVLDIESYLMGVVAREIGRRPPSEIEAVKAQAVAARTYAVGNMGGRENLGFDFFASVQDQVYGGILDEDSIASRALRETRGQIVTYDGAPILAYYSSTCGGRTAAIEESWPWRAALPYLQSVSDRIPGTERHYCDASNRFRWSVTWTRPQLLTTLGASLRAFTRSTVALDRVQRVEIADRGTSGRVTVRVDDGNTDWTLRADSVRWVLRTPAGAGLNSSRIDHIAAHMGADGIDSLTVAGGGWGHAIGMCQVGAMGRARAGQTYREILAAYYTGTVVGRAY